MDEPITSTENETELKAGARNNTDDRGRIRKLRGMLHDAVAITMEMEPADADPEPEPENMMHPEKGNALKTIGKTDTELRVGNYLILFGGRDLTGVVQRKNKDGSSGEYFTENTVIDSDHTKAGTIPVDFEHGVDPDDIGIDEHDILGFVDWKTAKRDKRGIFVERVLNRRNEYVRWLEELIDAGLIGNSTQADPRHVKTADNGEILEWPLLRDSLTVNPMEPRMLTQNAIETIKAASEHIPALKSLLPVPEAGDAPAAADNKPDPLPVKPEVKTMELTQEQIAELVASAAKSAVEAYRESEPATTKAGAHIDVTRDEADQPFANDGEFFIAVKNAALYPNRADVRLLSRKATGLSEGTPADGGYLVQSETAAGIQQRMYNIGQILSRVANQPIGPNSNGMIFNAVDETSRVDGSRWGGVRGYWLAEGGTKTASKPTFRQVELKLKKVAALVYATDELLQDATALEGWISRTVPDELTFMVEEALVNGDGVGKPLGIMNQPSKIGITRDTASQVIFSDLSRMWARRWAGVNDYVWLVNQDVMPQLDQLVLASSTEVPTRFMRYSENGILSIHGAPVIETEHCQSLNSAGDIILVSPSQYLTITKGGIAAASSIHVQFLTDETVFRFVYRIDGTSLWSAALTPAHGSNTQAPFVSLGAATA